MTESDIETLVYPAGTRCAWCQGRGSRVLNDWSVFGGGHEVTQVCPCCHGTGESPAAYAVRQRASEDEPGA